jgi:2-oxoisovalerate dehydrogenase E1 component
MVHPDVLLKAYTLMCAARAMAAIYEENRSICRYVHSTSRGHEAIQLATAFNLGDLDYVSPYYRDESLLLGLGFSPYELMLQLLAKKDDPFSGGRLYYSHPSYKLPGKPKIIHQSSATGMQVIPTTGIAQGIRYLETIQSPLLPADANGAYPVVLCSLGDGSVTEGEVSEAFQFAVLKKLPVIYLVQDNNWGISARSNETRVVDAFEFAGGFRGLRRIRTDGSDFVQSFETMSQVIAEVRTNRHPCLVQANVPLLGHHTSGVRKESYRTKEDYDQHVQRDPFPKLHKLLMENNVPEETLQTIQNNAGRQVAEAFDKAKTAAEPAPATISDHIFVPTPVLEEKGTRAPAGAEKILMVDAVLFAIRELMEEFPEIIFFGQDVGRRLGGVFREAATLAEQFGDHRVFNTAIQEAYIIGSTAGLSATGVKPIVEVQFADYIYPGFNQLVTEISKSCYLTNGKFPVQTLIRVPVGAYGGGGPYHSASIETSLLSIKGIKLAYPSNAADMKGLLKAAFLDPNPVILLEHKGLYWSKLPGTEEARRVEPSADYIIPLGRADIILKADDEKAAKGDTCCIVTYGIGVYWALSAAVHFPGQTEIIDLRTLFPLDEALVFASVKKHGRCLVLTEEPQLNSFAEALAYRISLNCFKYLDAQIEVLGALNLPAIPLNATLEKSLLPDADKVKEKLSALLKY